MPVSCSACGAAVELPAAYDAASRAIALALRMPPPLADLLLAYLAFFRRGRDRLPLDRVAVLLGELAQMIGNASVRWDGLDWSAPQHYWQLALTQMVAKPEKLRLPLTSHGYLISIIVGLNQKAEAAAETKRERARAGHAGTGTPAAREPPPAAATTAEVAPPVEPVPPVKRDKDADAAGLAKALAVLGMKAKETT